MRGALLLLVTKTFPGCRPTKSVSKYPITLKFSGFAVILRMNLEFCGLNRVSVHCPAVAFENGIDPKDVPITLPTFVVRKIEVKSSQPPGANSTEPIRIERGD